MPELHIETYINAPIDLCFDLARDIDLHLTSTKQTGETAIAGKTSGLIGLGETVTWWAKHFGVWQTLTSKVTEMDRPRFFADEMVTGAFKSFRHEHHFTDNSGYTQMTDIFLFQSPLGIIGQMANALFLTRYMADLLRQRNAVIKHFAENGLPPNKL